MVNFQSFDGPAFCAAAPEMAADSRRPSTKAVLRNEAARRRSRERMASSMGVSPFGGRSGLAQAREEGEGVRALDGGEGGRIERAEVLELLILLLNEPLRREGVVAAVE